MKYKETKAVRKSRINNSVNTSTKILKPKKGAGSYDRNKNKSDRKFLG